MIEKLVVRNFQKHSKFVLDLDNVTVIVGTTDSGKSSILRSLRWLTLNKPTGSSFIRRSNSKDLIKINAATSVELTVDGKKITRRKGTSVNEYLVNSDRLAAFGSDVPEPVTKLLNLGPENFSGQHDAVFWFSDTAGQVSKNLNRIVDLDLIDHTLANLSAESRRVKMEVEVTKDRLGSAEKKLEELAWVGKADEALKELELKWANLSASRLRLTRLGSILTDAQEAKDMLENAVQAKLYAAKAALAGQAAVDLASKVESLDNLLESIAEGKRKYNKTNKELEKAEVELTEAMGQRCPLCGREDDPQ
jgi:exonuclease SbcC